MSTPLPPTTQQPHRKQRKIRARSSAEDALWPFGRMSRHPYYTSLRRRHAMLCAWQMFRCDVTHTHCTANRINSIIETLFHLSTYVRWSHCKWAMRRRWTILQGIYGPSNHVAVFIAPSKKPSNSFTEWLECAISARWALYGACRPTTWVDNRTRHAQRTHTITWSN